MSLKVVFIWDKYEIKEITYTRGAVEHGAPRAERRSGHRR